MDEISILNRRLGACLGRPNGTDPRFAWKHTTALHYFYRNNVTEDWQRRSWADRIGPCWVLCQWRPPQVTMHGITVELTRDQWFAMFGWSRPFPSGGEYFPYTETSLGRLPNGEDTAFYIRSLSQQLEEVEQANKTILAGRMDQITEKCERDAQANLDQHENEFMESVADWEPASWKLGEPRDPGDLDGPVRFQAGVGDSPMSAKVGA